MANFLDWPWLKLFFTPHFPSLFFFFFVLIFFVFSIFFLTLSLLQNTFAKRRMLPSFLFLSDCLHMFVCLSVSWSVCLSVVCLFVGRSVCLSVCLFICLSIWGSVCPSVCLLFFFLFSFHLHISFLLHYTSPSRCTLAKATETNTTSVSPLRDSFRAFGPQGEVLLDGLHYRSTWEKTKLFWKWV